MASTRLQYQTGGLLEETMDILAGGCNHTFCTLENFLIQLHRTYNLFLGIMGYVWRKLYHSRKDVHYILLLVEQLF